ncbi:MAG: NAD(+)/NADH kinase [Alistipes putredinis]|nr:MAG: NAD(+)/NADH kinase [Alistipes putredinis]
MNSLARALEHYGVDFHVNRGFASELREKAALHIPQDKVYENLQGENIGPDDILLCYGGDGTILEGVRRLAGKAVPLLGINAGRLGFLANIPPQQTDAAIGEILAGRYEVEKNAPCWQPKAISPPFRTFPTHSTNSPSNATAPP